MDPKRKQIVVFTFVLLVAFCETFFSQQNMLTNIRLCVLSTDSATLQSQCVLCNRQLFPSTTQMCTNSQQLAANITINQAFCLIVKCIEQVNQQPTIIGRKKRELSSILLSNWSDVDQDGEVWQQQSDPPNIDQVLVFAVDEEEIS
ncbi:uncharacterized protein [Centruroides vittatus]|uniref:uncharacterized protein n=1 Tax=Centruroides vittatus TaxID=120091 RepID=UPI0035103DD6